MGEQTVRACAIDYDDPGMATMFRRIGLSGGRQLALVDVAILPTSREEELGNRDASSCQRFWKKMRARQAFRMSSTTSTPTCLRRRLQHIQ
jgi:hypothetical protein